MSKVANYGLIILTVFVHQNIIGFEVSMNDRRFKPSVNTLAA